MDDVIRVSDETAADSRKLIQAIFDYFKLLEMETQEDD